MIVVNNLSKSFTSFSKKRIPILNNVNLSFPDVGLYAIFGKSGSGKTTLLNIIGGLDKPTSGSVLINNLNLKNHTDKIINDHIGFVFQNYNLESNYTVGEILENQLTIQGLTDPSEIERRITNSLQLVKLEKYRYKQATNLSGGEKQRVALARAIIKGSNIILADEPTGNLDNENTHKVMEILKTISQTRLVILVTHEVNLIEKYADKYYYIQDGKIIEELNEFTLKNDFTPAENEFLNSLKPIVSKKKGCLFTFKKIITNNKEQKALSRHLSFIILKYIFVAIMSLLTLFISYMIYHKTIPVKTISSFNSKYHYLNFNDYQALKSFDSSEIKNLTITNIYQSQGQFQVTVNNQIAPIETRFNVGLIKNDEQYILGEVPQTSQISLSTALADYIIKKSSLSEFKSYQSLLNFTLNKKYKVVAIHSSSTIEIKLNYASYINYYNLYSKLELKENKNIFQKNWSKNNSFIKQTDEKLNDNEAILKVSINSFFKLFNNYKEPYDEVERINEMISSTNKLIQIKDSTIFIKRIEIEKRFNEYDFTILLNEKVFNSLLINIKPQILQDEEKLYFFKIETTKSNLSKQFLSANALSKTCNKQQTEQIKKELTTVIAISPIIILLLLNYYFIEKSDSSIKKTKQYGIYRAIGVSKQNLFYKEFISLLSREILIYLVVSIIGLLLLIPSIVLGGEKFGSYLLVYILCNIPVLLLIIAFKLLSYSYLSYLTPAQILSKYDI